VRQILTEWARIGGTKVVGGDKITGAPVTLKLVSVTERQALDIILRNVAGFMAAPRQASAAPGASGFDRILIMATSSIAPARAAAGSNLGSAPGNPNNGTQRRVPMRPPTLAPSPADEEPEPEEEADEPDTATTQPVFTFPAPPGSVTPGGNPVFVPMTGTGQPAQGGVPVISLQPGPNGPTVYSFVPNPATTPGATPQPNSPFTVIGSPTPGVIQPPPPPPGTPPPPTRPPGL
jgi:hypothetical protein